MHQAVLAVYVGQGLRAWNARGEGRKERETISRLNVFSAGMDARQSRWGRGAERR